MNNKTKEYATATAEVLLSLFKDEENGGNPNYHYELEQIDATQFFTGMILGLTLVYNILTSNEINAQEFTYLANRLIVQDMLEQKEREFNE